MDHNSNEKSATEDAEDHVSNEIREDKVTEEGEISQAESKQEVRDHLFSTYAKFSENLTFLTPDTDTYVKEGLEFY